MKLLDMALLDIALLDMALLDIALLGMALLDMALLNLLMALLEVDMRVGVTAIWFSVPGAGAFGEIRLYQIRLD